VESKKSSPRVTTSLKIDRETWKKAKIAAINEDKELSALIESAIHKYLDQQGKSK
jgi:hypothetical protein